LKRTQDVLFEVLNQSTTVQRDAEHPLEKVLGIIAGEDLGPSYRLLTAKLCVLGFGPLIPVKSLAQVLRMNGGRSPKLIVLKLPEVHKMTRSKT